MGVRERLGKLDGYEIALARWRDRPYARVYREIQPDRVDIPGAPGKVQGDPTIRSWIIDDWSGGIGYPIWKEGQGGYNRSNALRPIPGSTQPGLALGMSRIADPKAGPVTMDSSFIFAVHVASLFTFDATSDEYYEFDWTNKEWDEHTVTNVGSGDFFSAAAVSVNVSASWIFLTTTNGEIIKWKEANAPTIHFASGTWGASTNVFGPQLAVFNDVLYGLDLDGLYSVDTNTTNTRTQVVSHFNNRLTHLKILVPTDTGVQWLYQNEQGEVFVRDYNAYTDAASIVGKLPGIGLRVGSIHFDLGFTFVAYSHYNVGDSRDECFLWFKGNGQEGVVGPIPLEDGVRSSERPVVAGIIGDDVLIIYGGLVWGYNLSKGAIHRIQNDIDTVGGNGGWIVYEHNLFVGGGGPLASGGVSRRFPFFGHETSDWHTLDTGRFDFDYPGFEKIFTEVIIYTDEGDGWDGSLGLEYSVDGGSFAAHADTKTISASNRKHTFVLSDNAATVKGTELELRLKMKSDGTDGPVIRKVVARAMPSESITEYVLEIDTAGPSMDGAHPQSSQVLDWLNTIATDGGVMTFENPWEVEEHDSPISIDVKVVEVVLPHRGREALESPAQVRLRAV